jgi:signal transduction histidine kinase
MARVSGAQVVIGRAAGRVVALARRIRSAPDWPLVGGSGLGLLAVLQVAQSDQLPSADLTTALLLALGTTTPLLFVRHRPVAAGAAITAALLLSLAGGRVPTVAGLVAQVCALFLIGARCSARLSLPFVLPFAVYAVTAKDDRAGGSFFGVVLLALVATALTAGAARRAGRQAVDRNVSERVVADTLLEHVARGERARIARELHDVVAHHISMIAVQAEAARFTVPGLPAAGAERLVAIGDTARLALTEMRRLLGVLRDDAGTETARTPQPGLDQLIELVDEVREAAATSTRLIVRGRVERLDPGIELTAYRIVQESLTNARRHAPSVAVDVELDYTGDSLRVCVRDNGPGPPADLRAGHGLLGMRERAAMAGGTLWTGGSPVGGFLVEAVLPAAKAAS